MMLPRLRPSHLAVLLSLAATAGLLPASVGAAGEPAAKPVARPAAPAAANAGLRTTPATSRQQAKSQAKGLALAAEVTETISAGQLDVAARVLTGTADCEFKQTVSVQPVPDTPGYFQVSHQGKRYRMLPRETSTGAVRLEDPVQGVVWLQIPTKSMLMDAKRGQRMVDGCLHAEQRAAVAAAAAAGQAMGQGIGIVPQAAVVPVAAAVAPAGAPPAAPAAAAASAAPVDAVVPTAPTSAAPPAAAASR